jgi:predicted DNA-binding transcriptional regulator YafY
MVLVWETSGRLLRLLSLLQSRREMSGTELAERLGVTTRTLRRDVDRLRGLGYPVEASPGVAGYRLGVGARLPPLLLDDDEAVAVALGLRTAANGTVAGIEETVVRALAKLEQLLPSRLRHRVNALGSVTVAMRGGPAVDPTVLITLAIACRDHHRLRFDYRAHDRTEGVRTVEPHRLVHSGRAWYLVAWDLDRDDWRTYRVDRITPRIPTGPRFTPRQLPEADIAAYTSRGITTRAYRYQARFTVHAPAEEVSTRFPPSIAYVEATGRGRCVLEVGSNSLDELILWVGQGGFDFVAHEPPELIDHLRTLSARFARAIEESNPTGRTGADR